MLQFEIPLETVAYTVRFARSHGIRDILNPAPAAPMDLDDSRDADYFIPNESEAEALTGMPVGHVREAEQCARSARERGFARVILTLGDMARSVAAEDASNGPAFAVRDEDTSGAGDAFIGSFATFLGRGDSEETGGGRAREPLCRAVRRPGRRDPEVVLAPGRLRARVGAGAARF